MTSTQPTKLVATLFESIDEDQRLTVLDIGSATPDTVTFLSNYRCKLHLIDLLAELPISQPGEADPSLHQQFRELLYFPPGTSFDICLFWDLFNYLSVDAIEAFLAALAPYLHERSRGHGFGVHNLRSPHCSRRYGIRSIDELSVQERETALPGYQPHAQGHLKEYLSCFNLDRSMLLSDSRLELLLSAKHT
jgi:hypothetical protein